MILWIYSRLLSLLRYLIVKKTISKTDLYKNEQTRKNQIDKLDNEGGGFKPKSFKSSRSTQQSTNTKSKFSKEQEHQNAMFGPSISTALMKEPITTLNNASGPAIEFSVISSNAKSLMHENVNIQYTNFSWFIYIFLFISFWY